MKNPFRRFVWILIVIELALLSAWVYSGTEGKFLVAATGKGAVMMGFSNGLFGGGYESDASGTPSGVMTEDHTGYSLDWWFYTDTTGGDFVVAAPFWMIALVPPGILAGLWIKRRRSKALVDSSDFPS